MAILYDYELISDSDLGILTKDSFPITIITNITALRESAKFYLYLNYEGSIHNTNSDLAFASFTPSGTGEFNITITYDMIKDIVQKDANVLLIALSEGADAATYEISFIFDTDAFGLFIGVPKKKIHLVNPIPLMDSLTFEQDGNSGEIMTMSSLHTKYSNVALQITGDEGDNEKYGFCSSPSIILNTNHIYYFCVEGYQEEQLGSVDFFWPPAASPSAFGGLSTGVAGEWHKYTNVTDRSSFYDGYSTFRLDFNNNGVAGNIWFDGVMIIDLTDAFGAGNEPGNDWCRENIPYFTGDMFIEISSDGTARKIVDMFIGINGVAKKVKKAFLGINGIAKKVFEAAPSIISFTIDTEEYFSLSGMTWEEWILSDYNTNGFFLRNNTVVVREDSAYSYSVLDNDINVVGTDLVKSEYLYTYRKEPV